ncbi:MAG: UDP-glucose--hexose-1-phosphate uridylyltransferase [Clostridiales bacterium]|nr:UDP-glucose--hexose-1-phosphate uridylyltransferase [Clostridiales bacterium]
MTINAYIEQLIAYAQKYLLLSRRDITYTRNRLFDILGVESNEQGDFDEIPELPDSILQGIFACLEQEGKAFDKATLGEKLMDAVMLRPSEYETIFWEESEAFPVDATDWAYDYAVHSDYVKKSAIDKNLKWLAETGLEITINLSKPEKNNKDLQKQLDVKSTSYPLCAICRDNEGFERPGFSRRNMRTISLELAGEPWFWQYSPYAYFNEHGIAVSCEHTPMKLDEKTAVRLFDFVDRFPHYFIGNNAPLPRVGGSILMHDHFQGGRYILPMQKVGYRTLLKSKKYPDVKAGILDWHNTALRLEGKRDEVAALAYKIAEAWRKYENAELDILPFTGETPHSTASFIARKTDERYILDIILRNNRQSEEHPDGIFHAHREYHHIKSESIGLIEAMGLFILPARLKRQLFTVKRILAGEKVELAEDMLMFKPMIERLQKEHGVVSAHDAETIVKCEVENTCRSILENTAVFKGDKEGQSALVKFLSSVGLKTER